MKRPRLITVALTGLLAIGAAAAGVTPGASGGYVAKIVNSANSVGSAPYFTCAASTGADRASALFQLPLTEPAGSTTAVDAGRNAYAGTYQGPMTTASSPGACNRDGGTAYVLNGTSSYVSTATAAKQTNPTTFTLEVWFKTTTPTGKLIGFGTAQTGASPQYDRHLYITSAGQLTFGIYMGGTRTLTTASAVTDGAWHHVIATLAPAGAANPGMTLYLDGQQVANNSTYTTPEGTSGWWKIGYDNQSAWPGTGTSGYFNGSMRYVAVYTTAFTPGQVANHYAAGR